MDNLWMLSVLDRGSLQRISDENRICSVYTITFFYVFVATTKTLRTASFINSDNIPDLESSDNENENDIRTNNNHNNNNNNNTATTTKRALNKGTIH